VIALSPDDENFPSLLREYNSMDPHLREEFLLAYGLTPAEWRSMLAAHGRSCAPGDRPSSSEREGDVSELHGRGPVVFAMNLPRATRHVVELRFSEGESGGSRKARTASPSRGPAAGTGPGRQRPGGGRRRSGAVRIRIVVTILEE
jgi:hypothetical protein